MILIFVRKTEDWDNYTLDCLLKQNYLGSGFYMDQQLAKIICDIVKKWDKSFKIKYFKYRGYLKNISQYTFKKYKVYFDIQELIDTVGDDDFVLSTDDDDWYREDLNNCLPKLMNDCDALYWNHVVHCTHTFGPHLWYDHHKNMGSNNYCISGKLFNKFCEKEKHSILLDENQVLNICKKQNAKLNYTKDLLSCYVWHMGSVSFMTRDYNKNFIKRYKKLINYKLSDSEQGIQWTMEHFDKLANIHNQLKDDLKCL